MSMRGQRALVKFEAGSRARTMRCILEDRGGPMSNKPLRPSLFGIDQNNANPFQALQNQIDRLFQDFGQGLSARPQRLSNPFVEGMKEIHVDLSETPDCIEISAEIPGVEQNDIDVTLTDGLLTIKAEKSLEKETKDEEEKKDYHLIERSYGAFQRSLRLPFSAQPDSVDASFKNGVLRLVIAKPQDTQQKSQKVSIK